MNADFAASFHLPLPPHGDLVIDAQSVRIVKASANICPKSKPAEDLSAYCQDVGDHTQCAICPTFGISGSGRRRHAPLVFPCERSLEGWKHAITGVPLNVHPTHWRHWIEERLGQD
ncbi:hypothetical protein MPLB_1870059 [Mesorhizobium sp. ORS 3324]|nr:hypothetical protein MPLB_1870059 [Mesorhizobium sp. ORS 3324]